MLQKYRDITLMDLGGRIITVACDSCAGVGLLSGDQLEADGLTVGYLTARVPLMESLAIGAVPQLIINTLSVSMDDYGQGLVEGIKKAAKEAGIDGEHVLNGSSEDNFTVPVTALGVTVIGEMEELPSKQLASPCTLALVGLPKVGKAVLEDAGEIIDLNTVKKLKAMQGVIDILPVGSKGIGYEIDVMAKSLGASYQSPDHIAIDLNASAGPATCCLVAVEDGVLSYLEDAVASPLNILGRLAPKE